MKNPLNSIKLFLLKFWGKILKILVSKGNVAIKVTNIIKEGLNDKTLNLVVALTPTEKDDFLLAKAKQLSSKISIQVGIAMGLLKSGENETEAFKNIMDYVSELPIEGKAIFLREFSGKLGAALDDGKISDGEWVGLLQMIYHGIITK